MDNNTSNNENTTVETVNGHPGCVGRRETPTRRIGLVGTTLALGAAVLVGCGDPSPTSEFSALPVEREVSSILSDPGPAFDPDYALLADLLNPRPEVEVEFGGMSAPLGDPDTVVRVASLPPVVSGSPVEFGGMSAPLGQPSWPTQVPSVEYGGMPAPLGTPKQVATAVTASSVEFGGMSAPLGRPDWRAYVASQSTVEYGGMPAPLGTPDWSARYDTTTDFGPQTGPR